MNITELAKQAGFEHNTLGWTYTSGRLDDHLKKFANLVAAHKAEVITAEAYRCGYKDGMEAGAVICENLPMQQDRDVRDECADAIRARGNK